MHTKILEAVQRVGPDRVLYGSDAPFHHPSVEIQKVMVSGLSADLVERVLGDNARRLFRVPDNDPGRPTGAAEGRASVASRARERAREET
jgi:Amidohydrolase